MYGCGQETEARFPPYLDLPWVLLTAEPPSLYASATTFAEKTGIFSGGNLGCVQGSLAWALLPGDWKGGSSHTSLDVSLYTQAF